jgi:hypothetical protein
VGLPVGILCGIFDARVGMDADSPTQTKVGNFDGHFIAIGHEFVEK